MRKALSLTSGVLTGIVLALIVGTALYLSAPSAVHETPVVTTSPPRNSSTSGTMVLTTSDFQKSSSSETSLKSTSTSQQPGPCGPSVRTTSISGSVYCLDDVTIDTVVQNPGYAYFLNKSITFEGVEFATDCPSNYQGCPGASNNSSAVAVFASAIRVMILFPSNVNETLGDIIGTSQSVILLSSHQNPRAGFEVQSSGSNYDVYLLVSDSQP